MIPEQKKASKKMISVKVACDKGGFPNTRYLTCFEGCHNALKSHGIDDERETRSTFIEMIGRIIS